MDPNTEGNSDDRENTPAVDEGLPDVRRIKRELESENDLRPNDSEWTTLGLD